MKAEGDGPGQGPVTTEHGTPDRSGHLHHVIPGMNPDPCVLSSRGTPGLVQ